MTNNISLNNSHISASNPELQRRLDSQENFTAIDKEKVKQDAVEISQKAGNQVKENFIYRTLRNVFGVNDPKKFVKSLGLTLATIVGLATLGNKMSNRTADWGLKVDKLLQGDSLFAKAYNSVAGGAKKALDSVKGFLFKNETIKDIANCTKKQNRLTPKCDMTRGYGRGFVSIFSLTPVDVLSKALDKSSDKIGLLKKLVGDEKTAQDLLTMLNNPSKDNRVFCETLSNAMRKHVGCGSDNKAFLEALKELQNGKFKGEDVSEFTHVVMKEKGLTSIMSSWWPVNIINKFGKLIGSEKLTNFCNGNLGDSLVKFNVVNGSLADTALGKLTQKSITVPTESISNFVNDKSGLGAFLGLSIMSLWNNTQDAPKGQKISTIADDFVGTIGSVALAMPAAFATTYGLASLSNMKTTGIAAKGLKHIGDFFALGLKDGAGAAARYGGGAMRFVLIMFGLAPMFQKPIRAVINKVFGKPFNPSEAAKQKELEAQKNTIVPELGITQGELFEKVQANPEAIKKLQNDPELTKKVSENPKLLLDLLDGKDISKVETTAKPAQTGSTEQKKTAMSPANTAFINSRKAQQNVQQTPQAVKAEALEKAEVKETEAPKSDAPLKHAQDTASYIPSSKFVAKSGGVSSEKQDELDAACARADKLLAKAEKLI